jgi:hypothetical protein
VTTADGQAATATTLAFTPAVGTSFELKVNGVQEPIGDGTKVGVPAYFSVDGGTTARAWSAVASGDTLYWNGSVAGYELAGTDRLDIDADEAAA